MDINKINVFLATAVGGLIFKWLAGAVRSCWSWLNKIHPEEQFLVDILGVKKHHIRLSYVKYKISTKEYTHKQKSILKALGTCIILISITFTTAFTYFLITKPINWLEYTNNKTHKIIWLQPDMAISASNTERWKITSDACLSSRTMDKITQIAQQDKETICGYILNPETQTEIKKAIEKNSLAVMIVSSIIFLTLLFFLSLGIGQFLDIKINKKIAEYNKKENDKSYQYLT